MKAMEIRGNIKPMTRVLRALTGILPLASGYGKIANCRRMPGLPAEEAWVPLRDGGEICCVLDDYIGRALFYFGDLDPKVSWVLKKILKNGDTFLDLGANVGILTILGSRLVGSAGKVLAVEPNPAVRGKMERSLQRNECENVQVGNYALGAREGSLTLYVPAGNVGAASLFRESLESAVDKEVEVEIRRLGTILTESSWEVPRLVKVDVEGAEAQVLEGVRDLWEEAAPPVILFEHRGKQPVLESEAGQLLDEIGYRFYRFPRHWFRIALIPEGQQASWRAVSHDVVAVHRDASSDICGSLGVAGKVI